MKPSETWLVGGLCILMATPAFAADNPKWKKHDINPDVPFEGAGAADLDGDGRIDIFSGDSWYKAPTWTRFKVRAVKPSPNPHYNEDFANMPFDVNGDGKPDMVTCNYFSKYVGWIEHPGNPKQPWIEHEIDKPGSSETCRLVDLNGDGKPEILPATTNVIVYYELVQKKPEVKWDKRVVNTQGAGHGMGHGDVDGDGKIDIIGPKGWYQQPVDFRQVPWTYHADFQLGSASIDITARDVDGDKLPDIVWGTAHAYGLQWLRQKKGDDGKRQWIREDIDKSVAQLHTVLWADLDGKGKPPVLLTGRRLYGHEVEPGDIDPAGFYAFRFDRKAGAWNRENIYQGGGAPNAPAQAKDRDALKDFPRGTAGTGLHIEVVDIDKDGDLDLVSGGKTGLYLFENLQKRGKAPR